MDQTQSCKHFTPNRVGWCLECVHALAQDYLNEQRKVQELVTTAELHGWNGVDNSKILSVFFDNGLEAGEMGILFAQAIATGAIVVVGRQFRLRLRFFEQRYSDAYAELDQTPAQIIEKLGGVDLVRDTIIVCACQQLRSMVE